MREPETYAAREVIRIEDLSDEEIAEIEASRMPPGFEHLDRELEPPPTPSATPET
jgi:hypothetical protein